MNDEDDESFIETNKKQVNFPVLVHSLVNMASIGQPKK